MKKAIDDNAMRLMADLLKTVMPEGWGFTLLTFETNVQPAKVKYISNAQRQDMIGTMQAMLDKFNRPGFFNNPTKN